MKKKVFITISCLMLLAVAVLTVPKALAYFTDYESSTGSKMVELSWQTELSEEVKDGNKHISVLNTADQENGTSCVVRVQIFGEEFSDYITVSDQASPANWVRGTDAEGNFDGWWYYKGILAPGESTDSDAEEDELLVTVNKDNAPNDFNIIVVHESSRVTYTDNQTIRTPKGWNPPEGWATLSEEVSENE